MHILLLTLRIDVPWVQSLKEKRSEIKKLLHLLAKRNVSVIESDTQDLHKTISLSMVFLGLTIASLSQKEASLLACLQGNTQGEVIPMSREIL